MNQSNNLSTTQQLQKESQTFLLNLSHFLYQNNNSLRDVLIQILDDQSRIKEMDSERNRRPEKRRGEDVFKVKHLVV